MNRLLKQTKIGIILLIATLGLSSCGDEDWWIEDHIADMWRVVEVTPYSGEVPYRPNDRMEFQPDGRFYASGYGGFEEYGYWGVEDRSIHIDFDGDGRSDLIGRIMRYDRDYMALDVLDYSYGSEYALRLVRY